MNNYFSKIIKNFLSKKGFYKKTKYDKSFIDGALIVSLSHKQDDLLKIIQIGANDGKTSDYLKKFLKFYGSKISILFVEPQINLKDQLLINTNKICKKTSYAFVAVTNKKKESLRLYVPKIDKIPYSSLLASFEKNQIIKRFRKYTRIKNPKLNDHYLALNVPQKTLSEIAYEWDINLKNKKICDVLIVDAEGYDDNVIYSLKEKSRLPDLISFEWKNLSKSRYKKLEKYLSNCGFKVIKWSKADAAAVKV